MITEGKHLNEKGIKKIISISKSIQRTQLSGNCSNNIISYFLFGFLLLNVATDNSSVLISSDISFALLFSPLAYLAKRFSSYKNI